MQSPSTLLTGWAPVPETGKAVSRANRMQDVGQAQVTFKDGLNAGPATITLLGLN